MPCWLSIGDSRVICGYCELILDHRSQRPIHSEIQVAFGHGRDPRAPKSYCVIVGFGGCNLCSTICSIQPYPAASPGTGKRHKSFTYWGRTKSKLPPNILWKMNPIRQYHVFKMKLVELFHWKFRCWYTPAFCKW